MPEQFPDIPGSPERSSSVSGHVHDPEAGKCQSATRLKVPALHGQDLAAGDVVDGCYEIRSRLGKGGMATVYAARDRRLNREVALKLPSTQEAAQMLCKEAEAMAAFDEPGLPTIFSMGEIGDTPYIVMELIRGQTMGRYLASQPGQQTDWRRCAEIVLSLARTLGVLHAANLAHRDIKPENVILAPGDRFVLLDLGILRQERFIAAEVLVSGSPHYMAPETAMASVQVGEAHLVDIYALGVIAFELLSGRLPYDHQDSLVVMQMQIREPVPHVGVLVPAIPAELSGLVHEMMCKSPGDRPSGISEVAERLAYLLRRPPR